MTYNISTKKYSNNYYIMSYHNPSSVLRRQIKRCIEKDDLDSIKQINNLTPTCEYYDRKIDPIYTAVENNKLSIIKYLVEERKLTSRTALTRALDCNYLDIAQYLHEHGFQMVKDYNHVCSLESMKLSVQWGSSLSSHAMFEILFMWNNGIIVDRLKYLFELHPDIKVELDHCTRDDIAYFLIDYLNPQLYNDLMTLAAEGWWFATIDKLLSLNIAFTNEHLLKVVSSDNYAKVKELCALLSVEVSSMYEHIFANDDTFEDNFNYYTQSVDNLKEFCILYNLMDKACDYHNHSMINKLLALGLAIEDYPELYEECVQCELIDHPYYHDDY